MKTIHGLVVSGGGSKIAFEAGVLTHLTAVRYYQESPGYHVLGGVSAGALTVAMLGQYGDAAGQHTAASQLTELILPLRNQDVYVSGPMGNVGNVARLLRTGALYGNAPLRKLIEENVSLSQLIGSEAFTVIGVTELESGMYHRIAGSSITHDFILASASVPGVLPAVEIWGRHWVDGGVRNITPLGDVIYYAKAMGAEHLELDVILASPKQMSYWAGNPRNPIQLVQRALSIHTHEVYSGDLDELEWRNSMKNEGDISINARLFAPDLGMVEQGTMEFDPHKLARLFEHGLEVARRTTGQGGTRYIGLPPGYQPNTPPDGEAI